MAHVRTYNSKTLVGNWFEDVILEEDIMKEFLERKDNGELLSQKLNSFGDETGSKLHVTANTDGKLHNGDSVQIQNVGANPILVQIGRRQDRAPANLCITPNKTDEPEASASNILEPSGRNVFKIMSTNNKAEGAALTYGEPLMIVASFGEKCYFLASEQASFSRTAKKSRHNDIYFAEQPSYSCLFRAEFFNPQSRLEFEGSPIATNEALLIKHIKTNQSLALEESFMARNLFGAEYEVSGHTYLDEHKAERDVNQWAFVTRVFKGADVVLPESSAAESETSPDPPEADCSAPPADQDQ